jgi:hypothetical protein
MPATSDADIQGIGSLLQAQAIAANAIMAWIYGKSAEILSDTNNSGALNRWLRSLSFCRTVVSK